MASSSSTSNSAFAASGSQPEPSTRENWLCELVHLFTSSAPEPPASRSNSSSQLEEATTSQQLAALLCSEMQLASWCVQHKTSFSRKRKADEFEAEHLP